MTQGLSRGVSCEQHHEKTCTQAATAFFGQLVNPSSIQRLAENAGWISTALRTVFVDNFCPLC
jgi:hypothetical protein